MTKKTKPSKTGWRKVEIPEWFPGYILSINDEIKLGMLFRMLVMREPGGPSFSYRCQSCKYTFQSGKIHEEVSSCQQCHSPEMLITVNTPRPKSYEGSTKELIKTSCSQLNYLKNIYTGRLQNIEPKDFGLSKNGFYFQFNGLGSPKVEGKSFKEAILKAALLHYFLWDFDFDWNKVEEKNIKIYDALAILY